MKLGPRERPEGVSPRSVAVTQVTEPHRPKTALAVHLGRTIAGAAVAQSDVRSGSMAATNFGRSQAARRDQLRKRQRMNVIGSASRGGMRSVVDAYERDGFLEAQNIRVIYSYREGSFVTRRSCCSGRF